MERGATAPLGGNLKKLCEAGSGSVSGTASDCSASGTGSATTSLTWNGLDQLVSLARMGTAALNEAYAYDDAGRRLAKTSAGIATAYLYDGDAILGEWSTSIAGSPAAVYAQGATDTPLMRLTGNSGGTDATVRYYAQDGIGNTTALLRDNTSANQTVQAGNTLTSTGDYSGTLYPAGQLKDGISVPSNDTGWVGVIANGAAVNLSFPSATELDHVVLYAIYNYLPGSFVVEVSQSGIWVQVATGSSSDFAATGDGSVKTTKSFTPQVVDGLRVRFTASSTGYVWLTEMEVWSAAGMATATQRFDAWGNLTQAMGSIPAYGYTGREPDASGLIFYRARYYHPGLGRFVSRDPIGMQGGINPYAYAGGNPVRFNDPSGLLISNAANSAVDYAGRKWDSLTSSASSFISSLDASGAADQFGRKLAYDFVQNNQGRAGDPSAQAWLADQLVPYAQGYNPETSNGQLAAGFAFGATLLTPSGEVTEAKALARGGETAATIAGREAHKSYELTLGGGYEFNKALPSGKRPDAVDAVNNVVRELKPDSPSAISRGLAQLQGYVDELERITKQKWQGFLDTYNKR